MGKQEPTLLYLAEGYKVPLYSINYIREFLVYVLIIINTLRKSAINVAERFFFSYFNANGDTQTIRLMGISIL